MDTAAASPPISSIVISAWKTTGPTPRQKKMWVSENVAYHHIPLNDQFIRENQDKPSKSETIHIFSQPPTEGKHPTESLEAPSPETIMDTGEKTHI